MILSTSILLGKYLASLVGPVHRKKWQKLILKTFASHQSDAHKLSDAPGHAAKAIITDLSERGIIPISWPALSPDLNPIEKIWNWMNDWIEREYGERIWTHLRLREAVKAAWDAITIEQLNELIDSMHQAVWT